MLSIIFNRGSKDLEDPNFVFITKDGLHMLPYSVNEIYYLKNSGYYQNTRQVYNSMHQVYPDPHLFHSDF